MIDVFILAVSNVSPSNGSIEGGTEITISGQYFSDTRSSPLIVNVGNVPCTILQSNLTTIRCLTLGMSEINRTHYHGEFFIE